jgi:hypothetical protein
MTPKAFKRVAGAHLINKQQHIKTHSKNSQCAVSWSSSPFNYASLLISMLVSPFNHSGSILTLSVGCEPGQFQCEKGFTGCRTDDCLCLDGWRSTFPVSNSCEPCKSLSKKDHKLWLQIQCDKINFSTLDCGDGKVVTGEECDGGVGCCGCRYVIGIIPN